MWWPIIQPMFSFLSGAFLGLFSSVAHDIYVDRRTRKRLAICIRQEILSLIDLIKREEHWNSFIRSKTVSRFEISFSHNYFIVFEENADNLALLEPELIEEIIVFYNSFKAFVDSIKVYNSYFKEPDYNKNTLKGLRKELALHFDRINTHAKQVVGAIEDLHIP